MASNSVDELAVLAERSLHIVRFAFAETPDQGAIFEDAIRETLEKGSVRSMKMVHREMCAMAGALSSAKRALLELQLQERWGQGLSTGKKRTDATGARDIAMRGIQSQAEYDLVLRRANKIEPDPDCADEFEVLELALIAHVPAPR